MAPPSKPAHPFGVLAALRDALPPGEVPRPPEEERLPTGVSVPDPWTILYTARMVIARERKGRGGKTVTLVRFPDGIDATTLDDLARELRRALGTGAQPEENAVAIQGDLVERVARWLTAHGATRVVRG